MSQSRVPDDLSEAIEPLLPPAREKRCALRKRGITPRIARKGIESSERLGRYRWVVERSLAWLLGSRRLGVRYERRAEILEGLLYLACSLICVRFLSPSPP